MLQQLLVNGIIAGGIYALVALGFSVIYRTVKFFHFAHGVVYAAAAYIAYTLAIQLGVSFIVVFFVAMVFAAILGGAIDRPVPLGMRRPYSDELTYGPFSFGRRSERDFATLISSVELKEFSLQFISKNSMNDMN